MEDAYGIKQTTTIELSEVKIAHAREFFINKEGISVDEIPKELSDKTKVGKNTWGNLKKIGAMKDDYT